MRNDEMDATREVELGVLPQAQRLVARAQRFAQARPVGVQRFDAAQHGVEVVAVGLLLDDLQQRVEPLQVRSH